MYITKYVKDITSYTQINYKKGVRHVGLLIR